MFKHIALTLLLLATVLGGCADETVYDWQRPHDTYLVATFSQGDKAKDLKAALEQGGFEARIETNIKNGRYQFNVLADVYEKTPDTVSRLERISGVAPVLRGVPASSTKHSIPAKDI